MGGPSGERVGDALFVGDGTAAVAAPSTGGCPIGRQICAAQDTFTPRCSSATDANFNCCCLGATQVVSQPARLIVKRLEKYGLAD